MHKKKPRSRGQRLLAVEIELPRFPVLITISLLDSTLGEDQFACSTERVELVRPTVLPITCAERAFFASEGTTAGRDSDRSGVRFIGLLASVSCEGLSPIREVSRSVNESQDLYSVVE